MKPTDKPIASPKVVLREEFDNWAVLFQHETGEAVGVAIFRMLDGQRTLAEVAAEIEASARMRPTPSWRTHWPSWTTWHDACSSSLRRGMK